MNIKIGDGALFILEVRGHIIGVIHLAGPCENEDEVQAIRQQLAVESHMKLAEKLINQHREKLINSQELLKLIAKIRRREADPRLYLAMVGEFSSGKSTLINALIHDDLLWTDVLPATTAAATLLQYGKGLDVKIETQSGEKKSFLNDGISTISKIGRFFFRPSLSAEKNNIDKFLHSVSADERIAQQIRKVTVEHPSDVLKKGLVIVDTPGTNTENARHTEIAKWAIEEVCDAAVVVIPAPIPVSETLIKFLRENLSEVLPRCIFVVTKMDQIREKDRSGIIKNIERRLCQRLGFNQVVLLAAAPQKVVESLANLADKNKADINDVFLVQFKNVEQRIQHILQSQQVLIQIEKIILLLSTLYTQLESDLREMDRKYKERHEALALNSIQDLSKFIHSQKDLHVNNILNGKRHIEDYANTLVDSLCEEVVEKIYTAIDNAEDAEQLKLAVTKFTDQVLADTKQMLLAKSAEIQDYIQQLGKGRLQQFETEFIVLYRSLATLGGKLKISDARYRDMIPKVFKNEQDNLFIRLKKAVKDDDMTTAFKTFGGAGIGAVIGTLIMPVYGTLLGGAVGGYLGQLFGPSLQKQKTRYKNEMGHKIQETFQLTKNSVLDGIEEMINEIIRDLNKIINMYFVKYDALIKQMIERDEQEAKHLKSEQEVITRQISEIHGRHVEILHIFERLRNMQSCA
ncbi:MAG: Dynamin family protein [Firmicutes bacterium]|nr:Dynamin family protein [Bacillota bacterium]